MDKRLQGAVRRYLGPGTAIPDGGPEVGSGMGSDARPEVDPAVGSEAGPEVAPEVGELAHDATLEALDDHGLLPLLAWRWGDALPEPALSKARTARQKLAVQELLWDEALANILERFAARDLPVLIFKGQHLAQSHYPEPALRTRCDMDLFIRRDDRDAVEELFATAGYERMQATRGEHALTQMLFHRFGEGQITCVFDVHWQVSNRPGLAQQFPFDELFDNAVALTSFHEQVLVLSDVDALLLACAHRSGHHADHDRWIWLYDIHLLCEGLDIAKWNALVDAARQRQLGGLCRESLRFAQTLFGTSLNEGALRALEDDSGGLEYLDAAGRVSQWRVDAASLPLPARARWFREHLFPEASYMRERYGKGGIWLPFLYMYRAAAGIRKLFR